MGRQPSEVQDIGIFSDRSPRSKNQESKLQEELGKINQYVSRLDGEIVAMETDRSRLLRLIALGEASAGQHGRLAECVSQIGITRDNLQSLEKEVAKTEQAIKALYPTPEQSQGRRALQAQFTKFAEERFAKTKQVEVLLQQLRQALGERIELAGKMRQVAESLDCEIMGDVLDEGRFEDCLSALPDDLLAVSERWQSALGLSQPKAVKSSA